MDFSVSLANKVVGSREPFEVGHGLQVPNNDAVILPFYALRRSSQIS
jgi:hypothetical protein